MGVVQDDFTFATSTGVSNLPDHNVPFGTTSDCTAEAWWYKKYALHWCSIAAKLQIDLRESGVVVANSVSVSLHGNRYTVYWFLIYKSLETKLSYNKSICYIYRNAFLLCLKVPWVASGWATEILNFDRSADSSQIYCLVIGWCGGCVPNGTIYLESVYEPGNMKLYNQTIFC